MSSLPSQLGHRFLAALVLTLALVASACSTDSGDDNSSTTAAAEDVTSDEVTSTTATEEAEMADESPTENPGDDPAAVAFAAVLALLNDPEPDVETVEALFAPQFLAQAPAAQLLALVPQLTVGATGPWVATETRVTDLGLVARIEADGATPLNVQLAVDADSPELIETLFFQPAPDIPDIPELATFDDIVSALDDLGPMNRLGLFEIAFGECAAVADHNADQLMPIGSAFKLWILAELAAQVESGDAEWDELFPVQDRYKASPDGELFAMAEGTELTLRRYAELMISISDNGATDHLLHYVGRQRVEAAMVASGVGDPSLNQPFMSAADLFMIKFDPGSPTSEEYRALDVNGRRAVLDGLIDETVPWIAGPQDFPIVNADGVAISEPRDHDLEWFATPADLCRTHAHLADLATRPGLEPVGEILRMNAAVGGEFDDTVWTDIRYKGGSEQGLVAVAWWLERADGRVFVLAGGVENTEVAVDPLQALGVLQQATKVLADVE